MVTFLWLWYSSHILDGHIETATSTENRSPGEAGSDHQGFDAGRGGPSATIFWTAGMGDF